jgi:hypothetical protein
METVNRHLRHSVNKEGVSHVRIITRLSSCPFVNDNIEAIYSSVYTAGVPFGSTFGWIDRSHGKTELTIYKR